MYVSGNYLKTKSMNYSKFIHQENLLEELLQYLGIINNESIVIKINNYPDYNISTYYREVIAEYYFKNKWSFKNLYSEITSAKFLDSKIFHFDDIEQNEVYDFSELLLNGDLEENLNEIHNHYPKYFYENGSGLKDIDDFKVNELRMLMVDNSNKSLIYEGSFLGNNDNIDTLDYGIFSLLNLTGVRKYLHEFYLNLIAESYLLYSQQNYKLSFFICFSAIECFINIQLNSEEKEERLNDKLKELFKVRFGNLNKNQIYTSIINDFGDFTTIRNNIAHGKKEIEITESNVQNILFFTTILIASFESCLENFSELNSEIKNNNYR